MAKKDNGVGEEWQTNVQLYQQLVELIPGYAWRVGDAEAESMDGIHIPRPKEQLNFKRRGTQFIEGIGCVNASMQHPRYFIEPIRRWFNRLLWYP